MKLIKQFPLLVIAGGGLLGYVAAEMMITDPVMVGDRVNAQGAWVQWAAPIAGILLVIGLAQWLKTRKRDTAVLEDKTHAGP